MAHVRIAVHVTPRSSRDEITGWREDELAIKVTAAPDKGSANAAVRRVVARALGVPQGSVTVERGQTSRHKRLMVSGVSERDVSEVFGTPSR